METRDLLAIMSALIWQSPDYSGSMQGAVEDAEQLLNLVDSKVSERIVKGRTR